MWELKGLQLKLKATSGTIQRGSMNALNAEDYSGVCGVWMDSNYFV